ncbi:hypothetical protein GGR21_003075 [Dysgonomonas hofstadii]|uniref:Uncharacterized protein n=1 Tax=Dysgonomonas hofstadii TaxID=637886 RepID=A0A840CME1_9BACT|nr:hypothetical protein [Dysgonomonas hofstadii]MBB4037160.1 hypothetical protein [Dysgonomonas hofstadii]
MKFFYLTLFLLLYLFPCNINSQEQGSVSLQKKIIPYLKPYNELKKETLEKRDDFYKQCQQANNKDSIITEAQKYLLKVSDNFFRSWYNTPWTFHGHSQIPGVGSIACGYFVTTTLRDMGFNIPRIKWAQQASEYLIKKISSDIQRFHKKPMNEIIDYIERKGEGLYVVGLDQHVGYIYYTGGKMSFVHANYYRPKIGVMSEPLTGRNPLNDSKYRIIGKIFDREMVKNWIMNTPYSE